MGQPKAGGRRFEADVAQLVEHSLGKGEVTSSILVISSRINCREAISNRVEISALLCAVSRRVLGSNIFSEQLFGNPGQSG